MNWLRKYTGMGLCASGWLGEQESSTGPAVKLFRRRLVQEDRAMSMDR